LKYFTKKDIVNEKASSREKKTAPAGAKKFLFFFFPPINAKLKYSSKFCKAAFAGMST